MDVRTSAQKLYFPAIRAMGSKYLGRDVCPDICPDVRGISRPKTLCLGCFSVLDKRGGEGIARRSGHPKAKIDSNMFCQLILRFSGVLRANLKGGEKKRTL